MNNQKLAKLNDFINKSYECFSFAEFLKLAIFQLHQFVMYDSGMFFCSISKDCSFFKPYLGGPIEGYYKKQPFDGEEYLQESESQKVGNEAYVYKAVDYRQGVVQIANEPRGIFLQSQSDYYIVCLRIVYKGQFLGEIYLHRGKDKPDFDAEDLFTLRLMQPHVATVFNIIHTVTAVKYLEAASIPGNHVGICAFDGDLSLAGGNLSGVEMLKTVTVFGSSVLFHLKEICADSAAEDAAKKDGHVALRNKVLKTPNGDLKVDIFTTNTQKVNSKIQYLAVMQYRDEAQAVADYKFKFTKREADIIDGLIQGKNNIQLAENLNISANTIKTHIKSIYRKTGANNRAELTYVLMINRAKEA